MNVYASLLLLASIALCSSQSDPAPSSVDRCIFKPQVVNVAKDNCTGSFLTFSCVGHCHSHAVPQVFFQRPPSPPPNVRPISPYHRDCDCCTAQARVMKTVSVPLHCAHNNTDVTVQHYAATASRCGCAKCEHL